MPNLYGNIIDNLAVGLVGGAGVVGGAVGVAGGGVWLSLVLARSRTRVSMGTPTPMSRVSGSKSGGGSTGSRYGAWKLSIGDHGESNPDLSGVEPPFSTSSDSSASHTCNMSHYEASCQ